MAEFLIYKGPHWMDALTAEEIDRREAEHSHFRAKYERRTQRGDVIEVRPDGFFTNEYNNPRFTLVRVPGLSMKVAQQKLGASERKVIAINEVAADEEKHIYEYDVYVDKDIAPWENLKPYPFVEITDRQPGRVRIKLTLSAETADEIRAELLVTPNAYINGLDLPIYKHRHKIDITALSLAKQAEFETGRMSLAAATINNIFIDKG